MKKRTIIWGAVIIINSMLVTLIALNYYKNADDNNFLLLKTTQVFSIAPSVPVDFDKPEAFCIVYFEGDCNLCQLEIKAIFGKINFFKKTQLLFIASADSKLKDVKTIIYENKVELNDHIHFLLDSSGSFAKLFKTQITPTLFLYNHKHVYIKRVNGVFNVDKLLEIINKQ